MCCAVALHFDRSKCETTDSEEVMGATEWSGAATLFSTGEGEVIENGGFNFSVPQQN
jgi:hypothetical protein